MPRYKLTIEYDGQGYAGWQRQKEILSIQQVVEEALAQFIPEKPTLTVAGRTDAGVHATGQVAHVDIQSERYSTDEILSATNHFLKHNNKVSILKVDTVSDEFHARFSATKRFYVYKIINRRAPLTFQSHLAWHVMKKLNVGAMKEAATYLIGHHDFSSFRDSQCQANSPMRTLDVFDIQAQGEEVFCRVEARSFLHHQVRILTGTLVEVGLGKRKSSDIKEILEKKDRRCAGVTAPAHGLYLTGVSYDNIS